MLPKIIRYSTIGPPKPFSIVTAIYSCIVRLHVKIFIGDEDIGLETSVTFTDSEYNF